MLMLSTAVDVITSLSVQQARPDFGLLWYCSALTGLGAGAAGPRLVLHNAVGAKAVMLRICTVFVLGSAAARRGGSQPAPADS
ncbi:hypothetical protein [Catellatospora methionotrophica]|uniref:hypothetical protein n=1 Tax=Catellatospora methionotrophica TaxID=121620 RepID=UPI0033E64B79